MPGARGAVALLLAAGLVALGPSPGSAAPSPGHVSAPSRTLRAGCHHYHYHYVVHPGSDDWDLSVRLVDGTGQQRGYDFFQSGGDPRRGHPSFILCRREVRPGRYTIRARLRWYDAPALPVLPPTTHHTRLQPAHFRLRPAHG